MQRKMWCPQNYLTKNNCLQCWNYINFTCYFVSYAASCVLEQFFSQFLFHLILKSLSEIEDFIHLTSPYMSNDIGHTNDILEILLKSFKCGIPKINKQNYFSKSFIADIQKTAFTCKYKNTTTYVSRFCQSNLWNVFWNLTLCFEIIWHFAWNMTFPIVENEINATPLSYFFMCETKYGLLRTDLFNWSFTVGLWKKK